MTVVVVSAHLFVVMNLLLSVSRMMEKYIDQTLNSSLENILHCLKKNQFGFNGGLTL